MEMLLTGDTISADAAREWGLINRVVPAAELLANGCNLDSKNPRAKVDFEHLPPDQLADDILQKELRIAELMREIKLALGASA